MATIDPVAKSKLDAAVQYACKLRSGFEPIFEDGRLELTNNRAERNIKRAGDRTEKLVAFHKS
jgi:transposase